MNNIADKIAKIIAHAESTTKPEEAEAFMAKAEAMLEAHGLSMLDIGDINRDDPVEAAENVAHYFAAESYLKHVGNQLAQFYGCTLMYEQVGRNKFAFGLSGRQSAIVTFSLMFPFVAKQIRQLAAAGYKAGDFSSKSKGQTAIGNALVFRIQRMVRDKEVRVQQAPNKTSLNALVPVDEIKAAFEDKWPNLTTTKARAIRTSSAGRSYANKVTLNRQDTGGAATKRLGA